jgi:hypothetical protein
MKDIIFKIGLLMTGVAFLTIYYLSAENGRYHNFTIADQPAIFDSRTGTIYQGPSGSKTVFAYNYVSGKFKIYEMKK